MKRQHCLVKGVIEDDEQQSVIRELRDLRPVHYLFKIENYSLLCDSKADYIESSDFQIGGYNWRLSLYPKGKKENRHLSLFLVLSGSNVLTLSQEVNVYFKLFVYNQIQDKYLAVQDAKGRVTRFRGMKKEFGFEQLVRLDVFKNASNGYLVNDCCIFGAEVFVLEPISKGECASVVKYLSNNTYTWKVHNFAELTKKECKSEVFSIGGYKWTLRLYPNGICTEKGKSLSLLLESEEALDLGRTLSVDFVLRIKDQLHGKHLQRGGYHFYQFHASFKAWGFWDLISLSKLNDASEGYLVNGAIVLEVQVSLITTTEEFS